MSRFIDEEAELGSDNEENDDRRKKINKDDIEEDEDGYDTDLNGFVDHRNDEDLIGAADEDMHEKFRQD